MRLLAPYHLVETLTGSEGSPMEPERTILSQRSSHKSPLQAAPNTISCPSFENTHEQMPRPRKRELNNKQVGESATLLLLHHTSELGAEDFNLGLLAESFRHHVLDVRGCLVPA